MMNHYQASIIIFDEIDIISDKIASVRTGIYIIFINTIYLNIS